MTRLVDVLQALDLDAELDPSGHLATVHGERCPVYVYEAAWCGGYYTWCDDPAERTVEAYSDPAEAVQAGLRRAAYAASAEGGRGSLTP